MVERVFGVQFKPLQELKTAHFGMLWDRYRQEFTASQDQLPLPHFIEPVLPQEPQVTSQPPLRRVWFESDNDLELIQVQHDRFLYNNKTEAGAEYIDYAGCFERFRALLYTFCEFVSENDVGELVSDQFELTYMNHIPANKHWQSFSQIGQVFPDQNWHTEKRFLPDPENIVSQLIFPLPEERGRLYAKMTTGFNSRDGEPALQLELTARGFQAEEKGAIINEDWFGVAHEQIVKGFADLTSDPMHKIWKRKI